MNDEQMDQLLTQLRKYLESEKVFIQNPFRAKEMERVVTIAHTLFPNGKIEIPNDPLQMGAGIVRITDMDMVLRGETKIKLFSELISLVDNVEVYATEENNICIAVVLQNVLIKIHQGK